MDGEQLQAVERECASALTQYYRHIDRHEFEQAVAFLAPDVDWNMDGDNFVGREANLASMHEFIDDLFIRHVVSNMTVTMTDADHATVIYYMVMYRHRTADVVDGRVSVVGPNHFCDVEDKFVRLEEGWRVARRNCITTLRDDTAVPTPTGS
jgi:hypothetical protein